MQKRAIIFLATWICAFATVHAGKCEEEHHFECGSGGMCIPIEWICDNVKDCPHGQDESNCNYLHECPEGDFMCRNGECISKSFKCDGNFDCSDGSDEVECLSANTTSKIIDPILNASEWYFTKKEMCDKPWDFHCERSNKCIDKAKVCDDRADCEFMEDEKDCERSRKCIGDTRLCPDGSECFVKCDGYEDCIDGSDEMGCDYSDLPSINQFFMDQIYDCRADEYKCQFEDKCITKSKLCNGIEDCKSGEDESGLCGLCLTFNCEYKCNENPKGPECYCPEGSFLSVDFKSCEQANPCITLDNRCSQLCKPSGAFSLCYCAEGYKLANDGVSCMVNETHTNGELFFTHGSTLRRSSIFNVSGDVHYEIIANLPGKPVVPSLALNPYSDKVYFVSREDHHRSYIYEANAHGDRVGEAEKLLSSFGLKHIAVDWVTGNIYYTIEGPSPGVGVCTSDGLYCKQLVFARSHGEGTYERYLGLIVHPRRGILIWLSTSFEHPEGQVYIAGMEGSNLRTLTNNFNHPHLVSLAMDYVRDFLFVVGDRIIYQHDLNTLKVEPSNHSFEARSMIVFENYFYFIAKDSKLKKVRFDSMEHEVIRILKPSDTALAINNTLYYEKLDNACQSKGCLHICVLNEKREARCMCPDQYNLDVAGKCVPVGHQIPLVKLSADRMMARCLQDDVCKNGGACYESYNDTEVRGPICRCPSPFVGLYCEVQGEADTQTTIEKPSSFGWATFFWVIFVLLIVAVVLFYLAYNKYPHVINGLLALFPLRHCPYPPRSQRVYRQSDTNIEVGTPARTKSQSMSDLTKVSNFSTNPLFGSSPTIAKSNSPALLHKSPSAGCKLNLEE